MSPNLQGILPNIIYWLARILKVGGKGVGEEETLSPRKPYQTIRRTCGILPPCDSDQASPLWANSWHPVENIPVTERGFIPVEDLGRVPLGTFISQIELRCM